jgi:hypothetical protein
MKILKRTKKKYQRSQNTNKNEECL